MTAADLNLILAALTCLPIECRYHGTDFTRAGTLGGIPRCDSCKTPWRRARALDAHHRLVEAARLDSLPLPRERVARPRR